MSSIKQYIPGFIQGMTDQPDERKIPGQVRSVTNGLPDVTLGLIKRPGFEYISDLVDSDPEGKWFNIFAENSIGFEEQYICNISKDGVTRIWAAIDIKNSTGNVVIKAGEPVPTSQPDDPQPLSGSLDQTFFTGSRNPTSALEYFKHDEPSQLQEVNIGATTLVTNRQMTPTMSGNEVGVEKYEGFITLKMLDYGRTYSINVLGEGGTSRTFTSATSISLINGTDTRRDDSTDCSLAGITTVYNVTSGSGKDLAYRFTRNCSIVPGESENDYDSLYKASVDLINGGDGWSVGQTFTDTVGFGATIRVNSVGTSRVENVLGAIRYTTPIFGEGEALTADAVLSGLQAQLRGLGMFDEVTVIGSGIYVSSTRQFNLSSVDEQLLDVMSSNTEEEGDANPGSRYSTINNVGDLPKECKNGYIVKVSNSFSDNDDYYLRFDGNDGADGGGVWNETFKPGILITFNSGSMPHMIRRALDDTGNLIFEVGPVKWIDRTAGDDQTNPIPSFVYTEENQGVTINNMLLYRNRLVFLSSSNIVLSQSGDLGNWFSDTALTLKASDPIDINASVDTSTALYAGLVVNNGMLLFSKFNQFLFTTDSDTLSPQTAKSSLIGTYDFNVNSNPFNMASNVGFFSSAGNDSIFWEMRDIFREGPPNVEERSKPVQRSLPSDLDILVSSREDGVILASKYDSNEIWGYRFFYQGDKQLQSAWFKWTIPGLMIHQFNNTRGKNWVVCNDGGFVRLMQLDLKNKLTSYSLEGVPYEYYVYLDNWTNVGRPTYNTDLKRSEFTLPYEPQTDVYAYTLDTDAFRGRSAKVEEDNGTYYLPGNWIDADLAVGYQFEMEVQFPHLYLTRNQGGSFQADTTGSLTLHRVKVDFATVGMFTFELDRYGKDLYSMTIETTEMDGYEANRVAGYPSKQFTIPVYDKADTSLLTLKSIHPTPATLTSLTFEGDYTENYYKRV